MTEQELDIRDTTPKKKPTKHVVEFHLKMKSGFSLRPV